MAGNNGIAIVTGGSRGIGRGVVEALLREGWRVSFCSKDQSSVERALSELTETHGNAVAGRAVDVHPWHALNTVRTRVATPSRAQKRAAGAAPRPLGQGA